jgi:hypothetical protein
MNSLAFGWMSSTIAFGDVVRKPRPSSRNKAVFKPLAGLPAVLVLQDADEVGHAGLVPLLPGSRGRRRLAGGFREPQNPLEYFAELLHVMPKD